MKSINQLLLILCMALTVTTGAYAAVNPKPFVIPELQEWKGSEGVFTPSSHSRIVYSPKILI